MRRFPKPEPLAIQMVAKFAGRASRLCDGYFIPFVRVLHIHFPRLKEVVQQLHRQIT
jgi:hypothetical protein